MLEGGKEIKKVFEGFKVVDANERAVFICVFCVLLCNVITMLI
jgi:hypothetical protein